MNALLLLDAALLLLLAGWLCVDVLSEAWHAFNAVDSSDLNDIQKGRL